MLTIKVPSTEYFDEKTNTFRRFPEYTLNFEYSLAALSKWEAYFEKPFLDSANKSLQETIYFIECMCLSKKVSPEVFHRLSSENHKSINDYINKTMTATTFHDAHTGPPSREVITAEIIYYWMTTLNIPFTCDKWHLSKLFALVKVINLKNAPKKKMSRSEMLSRRRELNAQRRQQSGSMG